jgi:DNA-binding CsgD family transcriptional regulator
LVPREKFPIEGLPLGEVFKGLARSSLLQILNQVCITGEPAHLRDFEYVGLVGATVTLPGDVTVWDWEIYPLTDAGGDHSHLLIVGMDATERALQGPGISPDARKRAAEMRERASGILRIFGVAPGTSSSDSRTQLSSREREVAELVARGLSNAAVARQLYLSPATVATHVAHILEKLGFSSRVEIAAWIVERSLREESTEPRD